MDEDNTAAPLKRDTAGAVAYALRRLRTELPPHFSYHAAGHTENDVLPAAVRLARLSKLPEDDRQLLEVAAAFHDLGHIRNHLGHEQIGVDLICDVLPRFGFSADDIARVSAMVMATRLPQSPRNEEQALLADADLDSLGREDFLATSELLWRERSALGYDVPWPAWLEGQQRFLRDHRYFTPAARALRDEGKRRNMALLEQMILDQRMPVMPGDRHS